MSVIHPHVAVQHRIPADAAAQPKIVGILKAGGNSTPVLI
jgi:hypothetical protein